LEGSTANYSALETESAGDFVSSAITNVDLGLNFQNSGGGYIGGEYADLTVSAPLSTPEPSTWALMFTGVVLLGVTTFRRRHQV